MINEPPLAEPPKPAAPWILSLLGAVAGCATLVPVGGILGSSGPLWLKSIDSVGRVSGTDYLLVGVLATVLATVVALLTVRWWPWLLTVGAATAMGGVGGVIAATAGQPTMNPADTATPNLLLLAGVAAAGFALALIGVLGAAQQLVASGRAGLGALVAGLAVSVRFFGFGLTTTTGGDAQQRQLLVFLGVGLAGGIIATIGSLFGRGTARPGTVGGRHVALAGGVAALLPLVPVLIGFTNSVHPTTGWVVDVAGLLVLGGTIALAVWSGRGALPAALVASLTIIGLTGPLLLTTITVGMKGIDTGARSAPIWPAFAGGLVVGGLLALPRRRAWLAAGGCVLAGGFVLVALTGMQATWLKHIPVQLTVGVLVAVPTLAVASAAGSAGARGRLVVALGPLFGGFMVAGDLLERRASGGGVAHDLQYTFAGFSFGLSTLMVLAGLVLLVAAVLLGTLIADRREVAAVQPD
ncbi:hypothetical protein F0L68_17930 [Solihabitans fulvus]|uniref:Uncharacterized protein n=1 Tax=Solihabitans fulvus TaxID=1892852 RepID=A0A5B2XEU9_9PSEU|nr:hypothetical protein [Solihabitans fulvus]KAA2261322.1 hypothetical protein F0L68_17930 [Solihabitans fulvus]